MQHEETSQPGMCHNIKQHRDWSYFGPFPTFGEAENTKTSSAVAHTFSQVTVDCPLLIQPDRAPVPWQQSHSFISEDRLITTWPQSPFSSCCGAFSPIGLTQQGFHSCHGNAHSIIVTDNSKPKDSFPNSSGLMETFPIHLFHLTFPESRPAHMDGLLSRPDWPTGCRTFYSFIRPMVPRYILEADYFSYWTQYLYTIIMH